MRVNFTLISIVFVAWLIVITIPEQNFAQENFRQPDKKFFFRKPRHGDVYVIAHRGVHNNIPENSLAAYQKAIDLGCDFVEIDIRSTKDGKLVSVHNSTIDAYVKDATGKVNDFTLAQLKTLDIGEHIGQQWKNTRIPTLEEILQLCRGQIGIYLDLKEPLVLEIIKIIKKYEMERDVVWYIQASYMDILKSVKKNCSKCIHMPDPGPEENISKVVEQIHPLILASDMRNLSENFVKTAHANQAMVFVDEDKGTVDEWEKILRWGTDGIQTDHPDELIEFLKLK